MENIMNNGFAELNENELVNIDGGVLPVLFVFLGYEVTVGMAVKAGIAIGLTVGGALVFKG